MQLNLLRSNEPRLRRALQKQADPWGRQARRARPAHARACAGTGPRISARAAADARPARAAVLDEKAAAAQALGIYAAEARAVFAPHVEEALATLLAMANYFHDDVRPP